MSDKFRFGVIGGGNMAEAIVGGALGSGILKAGEIIVSDKSADRREHFSRTFKVSVTDDNLQAGGCEAVMLSVKPQVMDEVIGSIKDIIRSDALVISIAAGVTTARLDVALGAKGKIIRVMPNTPMLAGAGMSALCAGPRAGQPELAWAKKLFSASGKAIIVTENMMDAVTAVSGSGPAYFFYMIEAIAQAGVAEGLSPEDAIELAAQTCVGAGMLIQQTGEDPAELRRKVTSPGGTTQRAIETLDSLNVQESVVKAVRAAARRSRELGGS